MANRRKHQVAIERRYAQAAWGGPGTMAMAGYTQSRAADTVALGGIFASSSGQLPQAGGPEVLQRGGPYGMNGCGCGCKGAPGGCGDSGDGLSGYPGEQVVTGLTWPGNLVLDTIGVKTYSKEQAAIATGVTALLLYKLFKRI